jgi:hypothetical protein
MARPSDEFLLAWSSLSGNDATPGWRAIALAPAGPVDVQAGRRSPDNAEAILLGFPSARLASTERLPEGQGFTVERAEPEGVCTLRLALTRRAAGSAELFAVMACDVVGALDDALSAGAGEARLLRVFVGRVSAWQEFMRKGSPALNAEAEVGLVGELALLRAIVDAGVPPALAIESWMGPFDAVQDFELGTGALEVKSTLSSAGFPAKIGSLEQLDTSTRVPLFLAGARLLQSDTGQRLPDLVQEIRDAAKNDMEAARLFSDRLIAVGYLDAHADRYVRRFTLAETRIIEVKDDFPRLTPGNVPPGISRATYEIDLDKVAGESITATDALRKLGAL